MKARRGSRVSRPLSSAASFFRKNGATEKLDTKALPTRIMRPPTRVLECQPEERELLRTSVLPTLVDYLSQTGLGLDGLFVKDPSATTQEAMMGINNSSQREPVRALRELLDARFGGDQQSVLKAHHPYVWGISLKIALKELQRPILPANIALCLVDAKDHDSTSGKADYLRRTFAPICPDLLKDIFHLLNLCRTEKDKLGYMFSALLFLSVPTGQDVADFDRLSNSIEALSAGTQFLVSNAELVFGPAPFAVSSSSHAAPPTPPPPPPLIMAQRPQSNPNYSDSSTYDRPAAEPSTTTLRKNNNSEDSSAVLFKAVCIFDFDPDEPDELELRVGDVIMVLNVGKDDWWRGRLQLPDGAIEEGLFPSTYVKREEDEESAVNSGMQSIQISTQSIPAYSPEFQDFPETDQAEYEAASMAVFSQAPVNIQSSFQSSKGKANVAAAGTVMAVALFDFDPEETNELALTKGEQLVILDQSDTEWWLGRRVRDGAQGLFPFNYAKITGSSTTSFPSASPPPPPPQSYNSQQQQSSRAPQPPPPASAQPNASQLTKQPSGTGRGRGGNRPRPPPPPDPNAVASTGLATNGSQSFTRQPAPLPPHAQPVDPASKGWIVTAEAYQKYVAFFDQLPKDEYGRAAGRDTGNFLVQSGLPKSTIARVLELSDMDGDKSFDKDEFVIAMHLALCISKRGMQIPTTLPSYMVPKTKKHLI